MSLTYNSTMGKPLIPKSKPALLKAVEAALFEQELAPTTEEGKELIATLKKLKRLV